MAALGATRAARSTPETPAMQRSLSDPFQMPSKPRSWLRKSKTKSHNQNPVPKWLTQNHVRNKAAAAVSGWDCPLLTFVYPGFDCGPLGIERILACNQACGQAALRPLRAHRTTRACQGSRTLLEPASAQGSSKSLFCWANIAGPNTGPLGKKLANKVDTLQL